MSPRRRIWCMIERGCGAPEAVAYFETTTDTGDTEYLYGCEPCCAWWETDRHPGAQRRENLFNPNATAPPPK